MSTTIETPRAVFPSAPAHVAIAARTADALEQLATLTRDACDSARSESHDDARLCLRCLVEPARSTASVQLSALGVASLGWTALPFAAESEALIIETGLDASPGRCDALALAIRQWAIEAKAEP